MLTPPWSTIIINIDFLDSWWSPLLCRRDIRRTTIVCTNTTIWYEILVIGQLVSPHPTSTLSAVWRSRRSIQLNSIIRPKRQCFRLEAEIPSGWCWREAWISPPVGLVWAHGPFSASCSGPMWPCSHTTKGPRLSYVSQDSQGIILVLASINSQFSK